MRAWAAASACARSSCWPAQRCSRSRALPALRDRQRHRDRARLFAGPRRPAGDGRRRPAARQADLPQAVRRGDGDPGRRRAAGAGLRGAGARGHARRCRRCAAQLVARARQGGRRARHGAAARCSTCWPRARPDLSIGAITRLQRLKTGALIRFACEAGAILGKARRADARMRCAAYAARSRPRLPDRRRPAGRRGRRAAELGKTPGKDAAAGKATFVSMLGVERARGPGRPAGATGRRASRTVRRGRGLAAAGARIRGQRGEREGAAREYDAVHDRTARRRCSNRSTCRPTSVGCAPTSCASSPTSCAQETIDAVSVTGGHLGAGLGVVELTVALHYVFDTPHDRLIWDVGHQAYPHKILTGRRDRIRTLRQGGGLSGFTRRARERIRPVRRRALLDLDLGRARHGGGARPRRRRQRNVDRRDRRRRDERRHGLRGDEQRRRHAQRG